MKIKNAHGEDVDIKVETEYVRHLSVSPIGIPVLGFEDRYGVTPWGLVYNIKTKKYLKPLLSKSGYAKVILVDDKGAKWHVNIHRLVAQAYLGVPVDLSLYVNKIDVHHIDGNKLNNAAYNLYVCSRQEHNAIHQLLRDIKNNNLEKVDPNYDIG